MPQLDPIPGNLYEVEGIGSFRGQSEDDVPDWMAAWSAPTKLVWRYPEGDHSETLGIPCGLTGEYRARTRTVLQQVRKRKPTDLERLLCQVLEIAPLSEEAAADGTMGEFVTVGSRYELWQGWPGRVFVHADPARFEGTLAHELGHAAMTEEVLDRRNATTDEWASELAADWYAYRWGFAREIARDRNDRVWLHHCAGPGGRIEEDGIWYRVTRNFVMQPDD